MSGERIVDEAHAVPPDSQVEVARNAVGTRVQQFAILRRQFLTMACLIALLCWGAWMTRSILDMRPTPLRVVKVQLAGLVGSYVRAQARTDASPDEIAARTAQFMTALDLAIARHAHDGQIVLVSEAVVGGNVPDITAAIAAEMRRVAATPALRASKGRQDGNPEASDVETRMRDYLLREGAPK